MKRLAFRSTSLSSYNKLWYELKCMITHWLPNVLYTMLCAALLSFYFVYQSFNVCFCRALAWWLFCNFWLLRWMVRNCKCATKSVGYSSFLISAIIISSCPFGSFFWLPINSLSFSSVFGFSLSDANCNKVSIVLVVK